jgi:hypothetical protein
MQVLRLHVSLACLFVFCAAYKKAKNRGLGFFLQCKKQTRGGYATILLVVISEAYHCINFYIQSSVGGRGGRSVLSIVRGEKERGVSRHGCSQCNQGSWEVGEGRGRRREVHKVCSWIRQAKRVLSFPPLPPYLDHYLLFSVGPSPFSYSSMLWHDESVFALKGNEER